MTRILDGTSKDLKIGILEAMTTMIGQGSVPAATTALKIIEEIEQNEISEDHHSKMSEYKDDTVKLCHYLGYVEEPKSELQRHLGREPRGPELQAYKDGRKDRRLEVRAIELARVKKSGGSIEEWMR